MTRTHLDRTVPRTMRTSGCHQRKRSKSRRSCRWNNTNTDHRHILPRPPLCSSSGVSRFQSIIENIDSMRSLHMKQIGNFACGDRNSLQSRCRETFNNSLGNFATTTAGNDSGKRTSRLESSQTIHLWKSRQDLFQRFHITGHTKRGNPVINGNDSRTT